MVDISDTNSQ